MFLFGKKKKNNGKKKSSKKGKGKDKKWGKKERFVVLAALLFTVGTSVILALSARNWKLPGLPRIIIPNFTSPFREKTIVIEGNKEERKKAEEATATFIEATNELSGVYALYVVRLDNGSSYGFNEFEKMQAASLVKLPVMAAVYMEAEEGIINLEEEHTLKEEDKTEGSGSLEQEEVGHSLTYRDIVRYMGKESDNTAFNMAIRLLGKEKIDEALIKIGMSGTSIDENITTPYDTGLFFEKLWSSDFLSEQSKEELLSFMTNTKYEEWIAAGIPSEIRVAHKYGRELHAVNDAGIIYADGPFVLVIMGDGVVGREADEVFPELSREVFEIETQ